MTLKERLMKDSWDYDFPLSNIQAESIVNMMDNLCIEFLEWFNKNCYGRGENSFLIWNNDDEPLTIIQLLDKFKKEKRL